MKIFIRLVFHLMLAFRGLVYKSFGILSLLSFFTTIACIYVHGFFSEGTLVCSIGCVFFFVTREFYDHILLKINPTGHDLILYK